MKTTRLIMLAGALILLLAGSCSSEIPCDSTSEATGESTFLKLQINISETRGIIESTTFSEGDVIAVAVLDPVTSTILNTNKATYTGSEWVLDEPVNLASTLYRDKSLYVGAVYPYEMIEGVQISGNQVTFNLKDHNNDTDFLCGYVDGITMNNPRANILFSHMMSRLTLKISNQSRFLKAHFSELTFSNLSNELNFGFIGTMYSISLNGPVISNGGNTYNMTIPSELVILPGEESVIDILLPPTHQRYIEWEKLKIEENLPSDMKAGIKCTMIVNGEPVSFELESPDWISGQQYTYPMTIR